MSLGRLVGRHAKTPHVATLSVARHASFLARRAANHAALTPLTFLQRTAAVWPTYTSIVYDDWKARLGSSEPPAYVQTYSQTAERATRLASALVQLGIARGDTVAILSPNTPAFVEAHHGVNAAGASFQGANLAGAELTKASLVGADFREAYRQIQRQGPPGPQQLARTSPLGPLNYVLH